MLRAGNGRSIARGRNLPTGFAGSCDPRFFGDHDFSHCFLGRLPKSRTGFQVGDVGDVAAVLVAEENVDVVVGRRNQPQNIAVGSSSTSAISSSMCGV